jgi:hypothetical protein
MKDLLVVMACTKSHGTMEKYLGQLHVAGIDTRVEPISDIRSADTLGGQVEGQTRLAKQFSHYRHLIFSDAWDMTFYGTKEDVIKKIPHNRVLQAAERGSYPDKTLEPHMRGETAWKFVNGGFLAGTPETIIRWFLALQQHPIYHPKLCNQTLFNLLRFIGSPLISIDERTELVYCLADERNELQFDQGMPVNTVLGTHPNFLHACGKFPMKGIMARRDKSLGITRTVEWKIPRSM